MTGGHADADGERAMGRADRAVTTADAVRVVKTRQIRASRASISRTGGPLRSGDGVPKSRTVSLEDGVLVLAPV